MDPYVTHYTLAGETATRKYSFILLHSRETATKKYQLRETATREVTLINFTNEK